MEAPLSLTAGWTELNSALKALRDNWEDIKTQWDDAVQQYFEEHFWTPLENQVRSTLRGIERLSPVLVKVQKDCG